MVVVLVVFGLVQEAKRGQHAVTGCVAVGGRGARGGGSHPLFDCVQAATTYEART